MKELILAIQFLTRIPINVSIETRENSFAESVVWFPIAGLLVGVFNALVFWGASQLLPGVFSIVCAVLANVLITGGLHVDGLADTCDGIFSARKKERMLEIMKDSRIGTNGTIAVVFDILVRIALLSSLAQEKVLWVLILAPVTAKAILPLIMKISVYARAEGMGGLFLGKQKWIRTIIAFLIGVTAAFGALGLNGLLCFFSALLIAFLFRSYMYAKLQGMTGDTIGATNEVVEMVFLFSAALLWRQIL